jgi:hypothetical protein
MRNKLRVEQIWFINVYTPKACFNIKRGHHKAMHTQRRLFLRLMNNWTDSCGGRGAGGAID